MSGHGKATRSMHAFIMGPPTNPGMSVDHINRDRLDNRRGNLRWATRRQQAANRATSIARLCGVQRRETKTKGVRYCATYRGRRLGTFATEAEAIMARHQAVRSDVHIASFHPGAV